MAHVSNLRVLINFQQQHGSKYLRHFNDVLIWLHYCSYNSSFTGACLGDNLIQIRNYLKTYYKHVNIQVNVMKVFSYNWFHFFPPAEVISLLSCYGLQALHRNLYSLSCCRKTVEWTFSLLKTRVFQMFPHSNYNYKHSNIYKVQYVIYQVKK